MTAKQQTSTSLDALSTPQLNKATEYHVSSITEDILCTPTRSTNHSPTKVKNLNNSNRKIKTPRAVTFISPDRSPNVRI